MKTSLEENHLIDEALRNHSNVDINYTSFEQHISLHRSEDEQTTPPSVKMLAEPSPMRNTSSTQTDEVVAKTAQPHCTINLDLTLSFNKDLHLQNSDHSLIFNERYRTNYYGGTDSELPPCKKTKCGSDEYLANAFSNYEYNTDSPGGTPRNDRGSSSAQRSHSWRIMDLFTWIGKMGYHLYSGLLRARDKGKPVKLHLNELKYMKQVLENVNNRQSRLERENEELRNRVEELESQVRKQQSSPLPPFVPPPPPPPMPLGMVSTSNTIPRRGFAPPGIHGPRFTITPQDIANVKLRKTKGVGVRKPHPRPHQPLVTQAMLQSA